MTGNRRLTREELDALQAEIRAGAGDWAVTEIKIDGTPAGQYIPADGTEDEERPS
jgi:hypothetical protein